MGGYRYRGRGPAHPTPAELAAHLDVDVDDVTEALATDDGFAPLPLDTPVGDDSDASTHLDILIDDADHDLDDMVDSEALWPLIERLPPREQEVLLLRFYGKPSPHCAPNSPPD